MSRDYAKHVFQEGRVMDSSDVAGSQMSALLSLLFNAEQVVGVTQICTE